MTAGARAITPGALHRGRLFHVQYKPLYEAIGEPNNRNRKPGSLGRFVERLMLLDAVFADSHYGWLGTERDKMNYFAASLDSDLPKHWYPHLTFGQGRPPDSSPTSSPSARLAMAAAGTCSSTWSPATCLPNFGCFSCAMRTCSKRSTNGRSASSSRADFGRLRHSIAMPSGMRSPRR
jgi:hypothetical protein